MSEALTPPAAPETTPRGAPPGVPHGTPAAVPLPRRPFEQAGPGGRIERENARIRRDRRDDGFVRHWYENELGWPTVPGPPVRLAVGVRFDVLDVPAEAGRAALRRLAPGSPVAVRGDRMRLLVAAGSAEELPGLLEWLEWGASGLALDLAALGAGDVMTAPLPPGALVHGVVGSGGAAGPGVTAGPETGSADRAGAGVSQGAAEWVRPPDPGCEVEASLPTLSALGGDGGAPDLVRLVDTVAAQCHRVRLRRARLRSPACFS
ncbi:SCO3374 family protein [Streptomyces sp. NPDC005925]|uniref:SCO3374 family protein n=1 Tax=Streptomyces sp. NPDC005925 TaxID=3157172 RepID=UPI0033E87BAD